MSERVWVSNPSKRSNVHIGKLTAVLTDTESGEGAWFAVIDEKDGQFWWRWATGDRGQRPEFFGPFNTLDEAKAVAQVTVRLEGSND